MNMYESSERLKKEFEEIFGSKLNSRQLWFIVKVAKGARLYCRSNTAFNNYFNSIFGKVAKFDQIIKTKPDQTTYPGLKITIKNPDGSETTENGDDSGDY